MILETLIPGQQRANEASDASATSLQDTGRESISGAAAEPIAIVTSSLEAGNPVEGSLDEMATYLTTGSWGGNTQYFDTSQDNILTVNLTALTAEGQQLARWALGAWELVADLDFQEITGSADITFDDNLSGAFANFSRIGETIIHSDVNISTAWLANSGTELGSYSLFTYIHEIGHALGLGHLGAYDGGGSYPNNAVFTNDSYQVSVMSYFDQRENTTVDASYAIPVLPMMADIVAIQRFYGASTQTAGDTVWGANTSLTGFMAALSSEWQNGTFDTSLPIALTIFDQGGIDLIDLSFSTSGDRIDLREQKFSNVGGLIGNMAIARGTVIEKLNAGSGSDHITGNAAANEIYGGNGFDTIYGGEGSDTIGGGNGRDLIFLNQGNDLYLDNTQGGDLGRDTVFAGLGNDTIQGGNGDDVFRGEAGNDLIFGRFGNDLVYGGDQFDTIHGGVGDDTVDGGNGRDLIFLNQGNDLYNDNTQGGDLGRDTVFAGLGNDTIQGGNGDDVFHGEAGDDRIFARLGNDLVYGGDQFDFIDAGDGNDTVYGGNGGDRVFLGNGNDVYVDTAQTGAFGQDTITGGAGVDRFEFQAVMSADVITDFQVGVDELRLTQSLWGGGLGAAQVVSTYASVTAGGVLFDFGAGQSILLEGLNSMAGLDSDILLA